MSEHPRPRELERFAAGEPAALGPHLESCARCRELVAALGADRARMLARTPAPAFLAAVATRRRLGEARARRRRFAVGGVIGLAAAASLALLTRPKPPDGARLKGVGVEVFRKRGAAVTLLGPDDRVRAGDGLRISISVAVDAPVSVRFVDRTGHVDPYPGPAQLPLVAGANVLPEAVVVDAPCVDMVLVVTTREGELSRSLRCE